MRAACSNVRVAWRGRAWQVVGRLPNEKEFNWAFLDYKRDQFKKRGWMEFRKDLTDDVPFSLAAAIELLGSAHVLVGNMGSHVTRMIYNKMVNAAQRGPSSAVGPQHHDRHHPQSATKSSPSPTQVPSIGTSVMPPFISVDGYGLCCDFTEDCSHRDIEARNRDVRECIQCVGCSPSLLNLSSRAFTVPCRSYARSPRGLGGSILASAASTDSAQAETSGSVGTGSAISGEVIIGGAVPATACDRCIDDCYVGGRAR